MYPITVKYKQIIHDYENLKHSLGELLSLEYEKTFPIKELAQWILNLKNLNTTCPCTTFGYSISKLDFKCPLHTREEYCSNCANNCNDCHLDCESCDRSKQWENIWIFIKKLQKLRNSDSWTIYACLYLVKELKIILQEKSEELHDFYPAECSSPEVIEALTLKTP